MRFWETEFLSYVNDDSNVIVPLLNNNNTFVYLHNLHGAILLQRFKLSLIYRSFSHIEKVYWRRIIMIFTCYSVQL